MLSIVQEINNYLLGFGRVSNSIDHSLDYAHHSLDYRGWGGSGASTGRGAGGGARSSTGRYTRRGTRRSARRSISSSTGRCIRRCNRRLNRNLAKLLNAKRRVKKAAKPCLTLPWSRMRACLVKEIPLCEETCTLPFTCSFLNHYPLTLSNSCDKFYPVRTLKKTMILPKWKNILWILLDLRQFGKGGADMANIGAHDSDDEGQQGVQCQQS
jgi:hypothetical protein